MSGTIYILIAQLALFVHPVHYSVLNIEHIPSERVLSLSFRLMHDDMKMLAFHRYGDRCDTSAIADTAASDNFITHYLNSMLILQVNKTDTIKINSLEKKAEGENLWIYTSVPIPEKINHFSISNYLLMDIFEDQTNLVILQINGKEKSFRMDASVTEVEFSTGNE
ncbi:MAG: DUF6702 family protein [Bacteroidales bacterium]